jgi:hypothetical protein
MPSSGISSGGVALPRIVLPASTKKSGATVGSVGVLRGITLGGPSTWTGEGSFGRHLQVGVQRNDADGSPNVPCIQITYPGFWRFRWSVATGTRNISLQVKQARNLAPYPTFIVKKNSAVGLGSDAVATSPGGAGWVTIGPLTLTFTATGVVWVELWNNIEHTNSPALFDHLVII